MYSEEDCEISITFIFGHYLKKKIKMLKDESNTDNYK